MLAELGTSGNLDGQSRLIVKGRFLPKAFESVLRRYVNECALPASRLLGCCCTNRLTAERRRLLKAFEGVLRCHVYVHSPEGIAYLYLPAVAARIAVLLCAWAFGAGLGGMLTSAHQSWAACCCLLLSAWGAITV